MGTCFKGCSIYYRSIGQNVLITSSKYQYQNGYFGIKTGHHIRNIASDNPLITATDFYNKIAFGGIETVLRNGALNITRMADGTVITMRTISHSDGSPVVEMNISKSTHSGGVKQQKIHFVKEDAK